MMTNVIKQETESRFICFVKLIKNAKHNKAKLVLPFFFLILEQKKILEKWLFLYICVGERKAMLLAASAAAASVAAAILIFCCICNDKVLFFFGLLTSKWNWLMTNFILSSYLKRQFQFLVRFAKRNKKWRYRLI